MFIVARLAEGKVESIPQVPRELHQVQNPRMPPRVRGRVEHRQDRKAQQHAHTTIGPPSSRRAGPPPAGSRAPRAGSARTASRGPLVKPP